MKKLMFVLVIASMMLVACSFPVIPPPPALPTPGPKDLATNVSALGYKAWFDVVFPQTLFVDTPDVNGHSSYATFSPVNEDGLWSPKGDKIAVRFVDDQVDVYDINSGELVFVATANAITKCKWEKEKLICK